MDPTGENPVVIARVLLAQALKKCATNKVCRCRAMYAAYKAVSSIPGCKGSDSCATNKFKQYAALMHWTWRAAYIKMGCDKYIPTSKNHPEAEKQAMNKYLNCKKLEPICCVEGFSLW